MFNGTLNQNNNLFGNNNSNQQNNMFNQQGQMNQQSNFFNPNMNHPLVGANNMPSIMINPQTLYQYTPEQQEQILRAYTPQYIKQLISSCLK
jgi:hypothetical protein